MYKLFTYILLLTTLNTVYANSEVHRLYVDVFPAEANAKIFIWNIKPKFRQGIELKVGRYDLRVQAKGYHTWRKWIELKSGDVDVFEQVDLVPLNQPKPASANIIDEAPQPISPLATNPSSDIQISLDSVTPPPEIEEYILTVETIPSDAKVQFINSNQVFEQDMFLKAGRYKLLVSRNGYASQEHDVNITNDDVELKVILSLSMSSMSAFLPQNRGKALAIPIPKNQYTLDLDVKPEGAVVKILTTNQLYSPNMTLAPGKYVLRVEKQGYVTRRELIEIKNQNIKKTIELSQPPMCFYGQSQKQSPSGEKLYNFYSVRLNFYQNFVEVHYYIQTMPLGVTSHYEFKGIRRGDDLELIGLLKYGSDTQEELKTHMSLRDGKLIEAISGDRQVLQPTSCN
ncbi:hypothetical protein [Candidatus Albibeggiatoa sp. nov. NOAA]|uniref:hypothetical protein n=1 Tax=Candidatus Albibeggiatoa sp. nov. NOAA TaxID=3162724 RepID=UPI0032F1C131|nr:hypothetical protein [Thiotrichaceae bacterium]